MCINVRMSVSFPESQMHYLLSILLSLWLCITDLNKTAQFKGHDPDQFLFSWKAGSLRPFRNPSQGKIVIFEKQLLRLSFLSSSGGKKSVRELSRKNKGAV